MSLVWLLRCITIVGRSSAGMPALSHTRTVYPRRAVPTISRRWACISTALGQRSVRYRHGIGVALALRVNYVSNPPILPHDDPSGGSPQSSLES
ncbi:hypothetical protein IG631_17962 [Alternaria alternata]|nr:hypothetical protein IG631_17962 [Alternaria alternata]